MLADALADKRANDDALPSEQANLFKQHDACVRKICRRIALANSAAIMLTPHLEYDTRAVFDQRTVCFPQHLHELVAYRGQM